MAPKIGLNSSIWSGEVTCASVQAVRALQLGHMCDTDTTIQDMFHWECWNLEKQPLRSRVDIA